MLTCKDATTLVSRSMDGPLPWRQRFSLRMHLAMCRFCRRYERQLRFLRIASRLLGEDHASADPPRLSDDAKARIAGALKDAHEHAPD